ncbi:MAG: hypothetical protein IIY70_04930 [Oscillospiraceae bacterium]|nr:hypothetical protein [Oscillospiraceae bacterium]
MKKTLKTLSCALAAVIAGMSLASFADASATNVKVASYGVLGRIPCGVARYVQTDDIKEGGEYLLVADGGENICAMTASSTDNRVYATPVFGWNQNEIVISLYCGQDNASAYGVDEACVWTAVDYDGKFILRNNASGKYLGSAASVCTWDSIYGADIINPYGDNCLDLTFYGPSGYLYSHSLQFNERTSRFYLGAEGASSNIHLYEKQ